MPPADRNAEFSRYRPNIALESVSRIDGRSILRLEYPRPVKRPHACEKGVRNRQATFLLFGFRRALFAPRDQSRHTGNFRQYAAKGDRLHVPIIAQSRDVSREIMSYLTQFYTASDLRSEVAELFKTSIELINGFVISVQTCSYRAPRGITAPMGALR